MSIAASRQHQARRRILYVGGTGDVQGSYRYWVHGKQDPRVPSLAYSTQVYQALHDAGCSVVVLSEHPDTITVSDDFATFIRIEPRQGTGLAYHRAEVERARKIAASYRTHSCTGLILQGTMQHLWPMQKTISEANPSIFSLHNTLWAMGRNPGRKDRLLGAINRRAMRSFDHILCVSKEIERQLWKVAGSDLPTKVHVPQYHAIVRPVSSQRQGPAFLYAGRIETSKGVFDLLDAFCHLPLEKQHAWRLGFVGEGSALPQLRKAVADRGVSTDVTIYGQVDGAKLFEHMERAAVLVCPTRRGFAEGLAKTPLEAALVGLPSVLTTVVPARELLGPGAICVPDPDPASLANAIRHLLDSPENYAHAASAAAAAASQIIDPSKGLGRYVQDALAETDK